MAVYFESGFHKTFFSYRFLSEGKHGALFDAVLGKKGISVSQWLASETSIVNSMLRIRVACLVLNVPEQVDVLVPMRGLVDFLKRYYVGLMPTYERGDFFEILADAVRAVKALVEGKAAPVRDVECDQTEGGFVRRALRHLQYSLESWGPQERTKFAPGRFP